MIEWYWNINNYFYKKKSLQKNLKNIHMQLNWDHNTSEEYTYSTSQPSTSLDRKYVIIVIFSVQIFEVSIIPTMTFVIKTWAHIALHLVKQVQIIHKLMKCVAPTALQNRNKTTIVIKSISIAFYHEIGTQINKLSTSLKNM